MSWAQEQREGFIWRELGILGIRRRDLVVAFGVTTQTASEDLKRFREKYPCTIIYDASARKYIPGPEYERLRPQETKEDPRKDAHYWRVRAETSEALNEILKQQVISLEERIRRVRESLR